MTLDWQVRTKKMVARIIILNIFLKNKLIEKKKTLIDKLMKKPLAKTVLPNRVFSWHPPMILQSNMACHDHYSATQC
jgi:hypothetical protein